MGSQPKPELPTIDFSRETLKPGTSLWLSTCNSVREALEEYGCFMAVFNKVPSDLQSTVFSASKELFDLPVETKTKHNPEWPYFGYVTSTNHLFERFIVKNPDTSEGIEHYTKLMWPEGNDRFSGSMFSYGKIVSELDQLVRRMVLESYGLEKYCESHIKSTAYVLRLARYRESNMDEINLSLQPHTDKSFITLLASNQVSGLEMKTREGEWIALPPMPSSFIVLAGEAFLGWSNGRIHAPVHQVTMRETQERYSVILFSFGSDTIEVPEELVDEEHPLQFKPFHTTKLLQHCLTEEGKKHECTIRAFYAV